MKAMEEEIKKSLGTEDEPFEGDVPLDKVEAAICDMVAQDKQSGKKCTYLIDSWLHKNCADFLGWAKTALGLPTFAVNVHCDKKCSEDRYKRMNETEEIAEDAQQELDDDNKKAEKNNNEI